jgi:hypothetical protein
MHTDKRNTTKMLKNHHRTRNHGGMSLRKFARALAVERYDIPDGLATAAREWCKRKRIK